MTSTNGVRFMRCKPLLAKYRWLLLVVIVMTSQVAAQQVQVPPAEQLQPPSPQNLRLLNGRTMTIRWERFGTQRIAIYIFNNNVVVEHGNSRQPTPFWQLPGDIQRVIQCAFADADIDEVESFVHEAASLPIKSRYGTKARPITLNLPYGYGIDVTNGQDYTIAVCEVTKEDRIAMFDADQQLTAYLQQVNRDLAKVRANQIAAAAAAATAVAAERSAVAAERSVNELGRIRQLIQKRR